MTTEVMFCGEMLTVKGEYQKGSPPTWFDPGDSPALDPCEIFYKGVEISELLSCLKYEDDNAFDYIVDIALRSYDHSEFIESKKEDDEDY